MNQPDKPTIFDLMNQINQWKHEKLKELEMHDRLMAAKQEVRTLFS